MNTTAIRRALYGRLAGDVTLRNLLATPPSGYGQNIYYQDAPNSATYPLVIFQKQAGTPTETFSDPDALDTGLWLVKGIDHSASADTVEAIQSRVTALLNDAPLSISGAALLYLRRQSDIDYPEDLDGETYKHAGALFRLVTD